MWWGLASGTVDTRGFEFEPVIEDIQTLNEWALEGRLEVTAISLATYALASLSEVLRASIQAGLDHRREAMQYAMRFGHDVDAELADRFVTMYVNELTCDYGDEGRQAVHELLSRAERVGAYDAPVRVEFVQ